VSTIQKLKKEVKMKIRDLLNNVTTEIVKYSVYKNAHAVKAGEYDATNKTIPVLKRHFTRVKFVVREKEYEAIMGGEYTQFFRRRHDGTEYLSCEGRENAYWTVLTEMAGPREEKHVNDYLRELDSEVEVLEEDVVINNDTFEDMTADEAYYKNVYNKVKVYTM
jgi:hypothetical protein